MSLACVLPCIAPLPLCGQASGLWQSRGVSACLAKDLAAAPPGTTAPNPRPPSVPAGCNSLPDALHPHSFKSTFGHNTHLWAVREGSPSAELANLGPPASLFPLDYNVEQFFSPHDFGGARRPCSGMPPEVQVRCSVVDGRLHGGCEAGWAALLAGAGAGPGEWRARCLRTGLLCNAPPILCYSSRLQALLLSGGGGCIRTPACIQPPARTALLYLLSSRSAPDPPPAPVRSPARCATAATAPTW